MVSPTVEAAVVGDQYIPAPTNTIKVLALTCGVFKCACSLLYITNVHTVTDPRIWEIFGKRAVVNILFKP